MAILYTWQQFSRMMKECGLTSEETEYVKANVFEVYPESVAGLHEIAGALTDLMMGFNEPYHMENEDETEKYVHGSEPYARCLRIAGLLLMMIEEEQSVYEDNRGADSLNDSATEFLMDFGSVFSEDVMSVFVMEAAAEIFIDGLQKDQSEAGGGYGWLRRIFALSHMYDRLSSCCRSVRMKPGKQADGFFLRLLLLYRCLEKPLDEGIIPDLRKSTLLIQDILTESGQADKVTEIEGNGNVFVYSRIRNEKILNVLETYIAYESDLDIEYFLMGICGTINSMTLASADIMIKTLAEGTPEREHLLRLRYIDSQIFCRLFSALSEQGTDSAYGNSTSEYDIMIPEGEDNRCVFVRQNRRQLVRITRDDDKNCMRAVFRTGEKFERAYGENVDWSESELREAESLCRAVLDQASQGSSFLFSYVYLENYRTVDRLSVSFDHRFELVNGKLIDKRRGKRNGKPAELSSAYFYGRHIYSLTCLAGRNGAGKSSIMDFLRESFLAIKEDAEEGKVRWKDRCLQLSTEAQERYHLLWGGDLTKFLVVFNVAGKDYYLTNFGENVVDCSGVRNLCPYQYSETMNFTEEDCSFAYFSQLRYPTGVYASRNLGEEYAYRETIDRYVRDLSEEISDRQRNQGGLFDVNESLVHQLVFLTMAGRTKGRLEGIPAANECAEYDHLAIISSVAASKIFIKDIVQKSESVDEELLIERIHDPNAFIGQFSSGQHSRVALLSQLYWCLAGSRYFCDEYKDVCPTLCEQIREFDNGCGTRLDLSDTGVLFFDEGDLCFHPEWQRSYIYDIVHMVDSLREKSVQIIVTTNSPFMLSDILREDVYTMFGYKNDDMEKFDPELQTYGQNIHMLLAHRFFLDNTMGKMSEETLTWLFRLFEKYQKTDKSEKNDEWLEGLQEEVLERFGQYLRARRIAAVSGAADQPEDVTLPEIMTFLRELIDGVGERVYRRALKDGYERCFRSR